MEAMAAAVSLSAPLPSRCCIVGTTTNGLLASCSARRRTRRGIGFGIAPLRSLSSACSSAPAARVYAAATTIAAQKEKDLVFVAGATGKVGSRTVRELIKLGFRVRAAVRSKARASPLVKSVEQLELGEGTATASSKLELVECNLEKPAGIAAAIGNAAVVVCSIGASEKEILDVTGPYRIDYVATDNLVKAAAAAGVEHFILVTSLGTNKIGFPAFLLNLFWGVLVWKRRAEEALIDSGVPYTIVRPGGMERPTDAYKETHNLVVAPQDTYVGGQVSNLQVAELIACAAKNREAAYCKVVELVAETTARLLPIEELLARIPSDSGRVPPAAPAAPPGPAIIRKETQELPPSPPPPSDAAAAPAPAPAITREEAQELPTPPSPPPPAAADASAVRPLSPYTAYEGLKPPSSPTPTPSGGSVSRSGGDAPPPTALSSPPPQEKQKTTSDRPLSPYTAFVDLKPPASPSPRPPPSAASPDAAAISTTTVAAPAASSPSPLLNSNDNGAPTTSVVPRRPLSPYARYEGLKPPASPTPSAP